LDFGWGPISGPQPITLDRNWALRAILWGRVPKGPTLNQPPTRLENPKIFSPKTWVARPPPKGLKRHRSFKGGFGPKEELGPQKGSGSIKGFPNKPHLNSSRNVGGKELHFGE